MVRLIKHKETWTIKGNDKSFDHFSSIETAAHFLAHYFKVKDDELDDALVEMYGYNRSVAIFNDDGFLVETMES